MSQTSNNKRCQLIIRCVFRNLGHMDLAYDDVGYTVYRLGFSCLDYSFDVLISWSRNLGLYRWFCRICFHRVLLQISSFIIIIILYIFTSCLIICVLFHHAFCSYHIIPCMFPSWYHLQSPYSLLYACAQTRFLIHDLLIHIYRYMCAYPCTPLGIHHTTRWGVSDFPGSFCPDLRA